MGYNLPAQFRELNQEGKQDKTCQSEHINQKFADEHAFMDFDPG